MATKKYHQVLIIESLSYSLNRTVPKSWLRKCLWVDKWTIRSMESISMRDWRGGCRRCYKNWGGWVFSLKKTKRMWWVWWRLGGRLRVGIWLHIRCIRWWLRRWSSHSVVSNNNIAWMMKITVISAIRSLTDQMVDIFRATIASGTATLTQSSNSK